MAKSLRSKWRRKCRAVKRIRYGQKELERLKKQLGIDENKPTDENMTDISVIATVTTAEKIREGQKVKEQQQSECEPMDEGTVKRVYNPKTMKDQFGNYPVWMNKRRILRQNKKKREKAKKRQKKNNRKH